MAKHRTSKWPGRDAEIGRYGYNGNGGDDELADRAKKIADGYHPN